MKFKFVMVAMGYRNGCGCVLPLHFYIILQVMEMMLLLKKLPHLHLMCAVVEGQLLSKTQLEEYATYPDKLSMLAQTCATLDQASQQTCSLLSGQQQELVRSLKSYSEPES